MQAKLEELEGALEQAREPKKLTFKSVLASWSAALGFGLGWTVLYFSARQVRPPACLVFCKCRGTATAKLCTIKLRIPSRLI